MTHLSDFIQILLSAPGCRALACVVLALLALQALRLASVTLSAAWRLLRTVAIPIHKRGFIIKAGLLSVFLFVFAVPLIGWLQSLEYTYFSPVTITEAQAITPEHALSLYEARIKQHCDYYECAMVQRRTAEIAARINSTPLAIYEAALLERCPRPACSRERPREAMEQVSPSPCRPKMPTTAPARVLTRSRSAPRSRRRPFRPPSWSDHRIHRARRPVAAWLPTLTRSLAARFPRA